MTGLSGKMHVGQEKYRGQIHSHYKSNDEPSPRSFKWTAEK